MTDIPNQQANRFIYPPWDTDQVAALNAFQRRGHMHPFTCGALHASGQSPVLTATRWGWICPDATCTYRQDWAHALMTDPAAVSVPASVVFRDPVAALADDLRYVLNYHGPGHSHEQPGVWDTSGQPCGHCARLAAARRNLAAYDADPAAVAPAPTDRGAVLTVAERTMLLYALDQAQERIWSEDGFTDEDQAAVTSLRRMADEVQQPSLGGPPCGCPSESAVEHQFGAEDCTCIPFTQQDGGKRYCQRGDTVDMISGWEIGADCPHHRYAVKAQPTQPAPTSWSGATELAFDREIAARAATGLVGYRQANGSLLHCLAHKPAPASRWADFHEVTADDLEDGGICVHPRCGRDLLARWPAVEAQQPKEARACGPVPDECDAETGEPCADHEREQSHAGSDHSLCRRADCEVLRQS